MYLIVERVSLARQIFVRRAVGADLPDVMGAVILWGIAVAPAARAVSLKQDRLSWGCYLWYK